MMLAPIYSGSGFRMKAITALAHGLPVVTNALGARGCMAPSSARQIADEPAAIAAAALRWLQTPKLAGDAGQAAHDWAKQTLAADAVAKAQIERIAALIRG
jgi:glycosyltransferase involved in cell wall biosynthesis